MLAEGFGPVPGVPRDLFGILVGQVPEGLHAGSRRYGGGAMPGFQAAVVRQAQQRPMQRGQVQRLAQRRARLGQG